MNDGNQRREIIRRAFNKHPHNKSAFRREVKAEAESLGMSVVVAVALVKLAIACYQVWRSVNLSVAPNDPVFGEPDFSELPADE